MNIEWTSVRIEKQGYNVGKVKEFNKLSYGRSTARLHKSKIGVLGRGLGIFQNILNVLNKRCFVTTVYFYHYLKTLGKTVRTLGTVRRTEEHQRILSLISSQHFCF